MVKKGSKPNPDKERATALLLALERRAAGSDYPCTLVQLAQDAGVAASTEELMTALDTAPLKAKYLAAFPGDFQSLLSLKTDKERLASDVRLLQSLLQELCSPEAPHIPVDDLKTLLPKTLQPAFAKTWKARMSAGDLPDFAAVAMVLSSSGKGKPKPKPELHDVRFPLPWVQLSEQLLTTLKSLNGDQPKPLQLSEIVAAVGQVSHERLTQAQHCAPFHTDVRTVRIRKPDEWLALTSDADTIITSDAFLTTLLHEACMVDTPEAKLSVLKKQLPKDLQATFVGHWVSEIKRGAARPFFEVVNTTAKDATIRDTRFPRPEVLLSQQLVEGLRDMRSREDRAYPCTFADLRSHVGSAAGMLTASAATQFEPYVTQVISAFATSVESPIALVDDAELLGKSALLPAILIANSIKKDQQTVAIDKLAKTKGLHAAVKPYVQLALEEMISSNRLPNGIGGLRISKKWQLFRLADIAGTRSGFSQSITPPPQQSQKPTSASPTDEPSPNSFAPDFTAAFEKLDHERGRRNYLKLLDLRQALPQYSEADFDSGLANLRRNRLFSLESSEGSMVKLTDEEQAAGITDAGKLLTYCRRRS